MSANLIETPEWVWTLLDALSEYEDTHASLYRFTGNGGDGYERAQCFGGFLTERDAWPPREMQDAAEFRRHILREATTTPADTIGDLTDTEREQLLIAWPWPKEAATTRDGFEQVLTAVRAIIANRLGTPEEATCSA